MCNNVTLSIVIRTYNSEGTLQELLQSLPLIEGDELIIVDSGSTDNTMAIAASHDAVIVKTPPPFNYSRSLNEGFMIAKNDWVMVLSSHCLPSRKELLNRIREVVAEADSDVAVIYGKTALYDTGKNVAGIQRGKLKDFESKNFIPGGNRIAVYPKRLWEEYPFDEELSTAEDFEWFKWAMKSGYQALSVNDAVFIYRNQGGLAYMFGKGWNETKALRMMNGTLNVKSPVLTVMRNLLLNMMHLSKALLTGKCSFGMFLRMISHGLGAALANRSTG